MAIVFGCAEGMPGPDEFGRAQPLGNAATPLPSMGGGAGGGGMGGGMASPPAETPPVIMGPPCKMGERADCTCSDGVMVGVQMCQFDPLSPTQGSFGACTQCTMPAPTEPPDAGMPMAGMGGGAAGSAGAAGAAGSASGSGGSSGSAAGSGGMSGMGGMGGSGGSAMPMCDPDDCPPTTGLFGIERRPCCTRGGRCGGINALSGDCESG